jgi:hypothetical protein
MYEIRIYRIDGGQKVRKATVKKSGQWFGFFAWLRLSFTLRKQEKMRKERERGIAADCSPVNARRSRI